MCCAAGLSKVKIKFLSQPADSALGTVIEQFVENHGQPKALTIVSAFASLTTVFRVKKYFSDLDKKSASKLVLGVDLGGTSKEVLKEVASWSVPVFIIKNRFPAVTFHPKIYHLKWDKLAIIAVGSNNLTDGGLYKNYEAASVTSFEIPSDIADYKAAVADLKAFFEPSGDTAKLLTEDYLEKLIALPEIPSEVSASRSRGEARRNKPAGELGDVFGSEQVNFPPKLPPELQALILAARKGQLDEWEKEKKAEKKKVKAGDPIIVAEVSPTPPPPLAELDARDFYMELPSMRGAAHATIPGEARVPLLARDMAPSFWGWPDNYVRSVSPRNATVERVYWNWKPKWIIKSTINSEESENEVRMYLYENSADYRFYAGKLVSLGAESGDIIRIRRIDDGDIAYECFLAKPGSKKFEAWSKLLVNSVSAGGNVRRFGYA